MVDFSEIKMRLILLLRKGISFPPAKYSAIILFSIFGVLSAYGIYQSLFFYYTANQKIRLNPSERKVFQPVSVSPISIQAILNRDLFNKDGDTEDAAGSLCPAHPVKSSLNVIVSGILFTKGEEEASLALMSSAQGYKNDGKLYRVGDVVSGRQIVSIEKDRILLSNHQCEEYLEINYPNPYAVQDKSGSPGGNNYSEPGFERRGNNTIVTREWVDDAISNNLPKILGDARAVPDVVGNQIKGFTLVQIIPGSVYEKLGLKNRDVIQSINGIPLNDAARAIQTLNSLRNESSLNLRVMRGGREVTMKVNVQ